MLLYTVHLPECFLLLHTWNDKWWTTLGHLHQSPLITLQHLHVFVLEFQILLNCCLSYIFHYTILSGQPFFEHQIQFQYFNFSIFKPLLVVRSLLLICINFGGLSSIQTYSIHTFSSVALELLSIIDTIYGTLIT